MSQVKIVLVEDHTENNELMSEMLLEEKQAWEILSACNGEEALNLVKELHPDLVVTDLNTSKINGLELCHLVTKCFSIPVIVVTNFGDATTRASCFEAGASAYITKPFHREDLINKVRIVLCR